MKYMLKLIFFVVLCLRMAPPAFAAVPQGTAFSFQGRIDLGGGPPVTRANLRFRLYDGADPATSNVVGGPIYKCLEPIDKGGLFSVALNFGPIFDGMAYSLEVSLDAAVDSPCPDLVTWLPLSPLYPIYSTPYASFALQGPTTSCPAGEVLQVANGDGTGICVPNGSGALNVDQCPIDSAIRIINPDGKVVCDADDVGIVDVTPCTDGSAIRTLNNDGTVLCETDDVGIVDVTPCADGSAIRTLNNDGTVLCETDDIGIVDVTPCPIGSCIRALSNDGTVVCETDDVGFTTIDPCTAGSSIRVVNPDGSVICEADDGADNLGNHTATQNLRLSERWLSNDGGNEGVYVDTNGAVTVQGAQIDGASTFAVSNTAAVNTNLEIRSAADVDSHIKFMRDGVEEGVISFDHINNYFSLRIPVGSGNNPKMRILSNGDVGIGIDSPAQKLHVNGRIRMESLNTVSGSNQICQNDNGLLGRCSSSRRYKHDITDFAEGMDLIEKLRPVTFHWTESDDLDVGLIAEEVAAANPLFATHLEDQIQGVKYGQLTVALINALKEQQAEIDALKKIVCLDRPEVCEEGMPLK